MSALTIPPAWVEEGDLGTLPPPVPAPRLLLPPRCGAPPYFATFLGMQVIQAWGGCASVPSSETLGRGHVEHLGLPLQDASQELPDAAFLCHLRRLCLEICPEGGPRPKHHQTEARGGDIGHHQAVLRPVQ